MPAQPEEQKNSIPEQSSETIKDDQIVVNGNDNSSQTETSVDNNKLDNEIISEVSSKEPAVVVQEPPKEPEQEKIVTKEEEPKPEEPKKEEIVEEKKAEPEPEPAKIEETKPEPEPEETTVI